MYKPYFSFILAFLIWLLILTMSYYFVPNKNIVLNEIQIDAEMFGEIIAKKKMPKFTKKVSKIDNDKQTSDLKEVPKQEKIQHHDHHYDSQDNDKDVAPTTKKILFRPLPQIPRKLRKEAFKTKAIVRFFVSRDGDVKKIILLKASHNPELNFLLMKELKKWKFEKTDKDFTQDVNVSFEVK